MPRILQFDDTIPERPKLIEPSISHGGYGEIGSSSEQLPGLKVLLEELTDFRKEVSYIVADELTGPDVRRKLERGIGRVRAAMNYVRSYGSVNIARTNEQTAILKNALDSAHEIAQMASDRPATPRRQTVEVTISSTPVTVPGPWIDWDGSSGQECPVRHEFGDAMCDQSLFIGVRLGSLNWSYNYNPVLKYRVTGLRASGRATYLLTTTESYPDDGCNWIPWVGTNSYGEAAPDGMVRVQFASGAIETGLATDFSWSRPGPTGPTTIVRYTHEGFF